MVGFDAVIGNPPYNASGATGNINYKFLTERMDMIREELMMKSMHPSRLERFLEMGGEIDDF